MRNDGPPFEHEPRTDREWRLLFEWRLEQVERRLDNLTRAIMAVLVVVVGGVLVYLLTPPNTQRASHDLILSLWEKVL